jgi:hypothetical protein
MKELKLLTLRVVAKEDYENKTKVFYLNSTEPKSQQLYMAMINGSEIVSLTIYNLKSNQFEEVTALFQPSFLNNLSQQLLNQLIYYNQAKAL